MADDKLLPEEEAHVDVLAKRAGCNRDNIERQIQQKSGSQDNFGEWTKIASRLDGGKPTSEDETRVNVLAKRAGCDHDDIVRKIQLQRGLQDNFGQFNQIASRMVDGKLTSEDKARVDELAKTVDGGQDFIMFQIDCILSGRFRKHMTSGVIAA